ncbi:MAG: siroheme synthase CysG [Pseudomonadota bacterium]
MQHFPIYLDLAGRRVVLAGGEGAALSKLRLLLKTEATITVFAPDPDAQIEAWAADGRLTLVRRTLEPGDALCAALFYAATDDEGEDARVARLARADGALVNMVDNLTGSQFITPAIVDRDPVTVAIGTEGAAPVLARRIKADLEERLSPRLGALARVAQAARGAAMALAPGRARRAFWSDWFERTGPEATDADLPGALDALLERHLSAEATPGRVDIVGAGPGDPEMLTLRARRLLHDADVVIHDALVPQEILELARREADILPMGKTGFGPSVPQAEIDAAIVEQARAGKRVVRLKSGDPGIFGRLEEELTALREAGIDHAVTPGITAASAAAASAGRALTVRGRNREIRFITAHDMKGFAENDWRGLAAPGAVTAVYMGRRAARFVQGRLLMHGAAPDTPVTVVENASRPEERTLTSTLATLAADLDEFDNAGPAVLLIGLAPAANAARTPAPSLKEHA